MEEYNAELYSWECPEHIPDPDCISIAQQRWCICVHHSWHGEGEYTKLHYRTYPCRDHEALLYFALEDYKQAFYGNDYGRITLEWNTDYDVLYCTERHCNEGSVYWFEPEDDDENLKCECEGKKDLRCSTMRYCKEEEEKNYEEDS